MLGFVGRYALGFDMEFYSLELRRGLVFEAGILRLSPPP